MQSEYSLWTRDPEDEVLPTLRELGIGLVPYSPLGRGFLTGQIRSLDDLAEDDWRRTNPRFQGEAFEENVRLADRVAELAEGIGATPAQVALAWVLAQGEDMVPIPGTKSPKRLEENAAAADLELTDDQLEELSDAVSRDAVRGERYDDAGMTFLNNSRTRPIPATALAGCGRGRDGRVCGRGRGSRASSAGSSSRRRRERHRGVRGRSRTPRSRHDSSTVQDRCGELVALCATNPPQHERHVSGPAREPDLRGGRVTGPWSS